MIALEPRRLYLAALVLTATLLTSCWGNWGTPTEPDATRAEAYVPIYEENPSVNVIKSTGPKPIVMSGKIYVRGNLLFQVENMAGIHVIDYSDKQHPVKLGFIYVTGCTEIAAKGNYLVTNHMGDLVTIDISNAAEVKEVARIKNAFPDYGFQQNMMLRPEKSGYFVCPDYTKGYVKGWKLEKNVKGAHCFN